MEMQTGMGCLPGWRPRGRHLMSHGQAVRVALVDDHEMFIDSLARLLDDRPEVEIVGTGNTRADAVALAGDADPDVLVLDFQLAEDDAPEVIAAVHRVAPGVRVVVLTGRSDDRTMVAAFDAGCAGFVTKSGSVDELVRAVLHVHGGEAYVPAARLAGLLPHLSGRSSPVGGDLTRREREVLDQLGGGSSTADIAAALAISVHTVRNHVQSILLKLDVHSQLEAVAVASREGLLDTAR